MNTYAYRNLQNGLWSIQQKLDGRMTVVAHCEHVELRDVTVKQNDNMLAKIRTADRRKVCTMIAGELVHATGITPFKNRPLTIEGARMPCQLPGRVVTFNPHIDDTLVFDRIGSKIPYSGSRYVILDSTHVMTAI